MITYGSNINLIGWALVSKTTQEDGSTETVLRGAVTALADALDYAQRLPNDEIRVDKDPATGTATITVTASSDSSPSKTDEGDATPTNDPNLSEPPEVALTGSMAAVPIHQAPKFGLGDESSGGLSVQEVQAVETRIRDTGTVTQKDCASDLQADYASWRLIGQETFLKPTYTLNITFHIRSDKRDQAKNYIKDAGKVLTWQQALAQVPSARRPPQPSGFDQWLACAPSITQTQIGCDVTISFIGARAFPNYYSGGSWTPPPLDTGRESTGGESAGGSEGGGESGESGESGSDSGETQS